MFVSKQVTVRTLLLSFFVLLCATTLSAQINLTEDFEDAFNNGWSSINSFNSSTSQNCSGKSFRENLYGSVPSSFLESPTVSNTTADEVTVNFVYKIVDYNTNNIADPYDGTVTFGYSINGGVVQNLTTLLPQTDNTTCAGANFTIPAGTLTAGDQLAFRFDMDRGTVGDWDVVIDDFSAIQPGACMPATASYETVADCANNQFTIEVNVTNLGSASLLSVEDNRGNLAQTTGTTGVLTFGPYASGGNAMFTLTDANDPTCTTNSLDFEFTCPPANDLCSGAEALTVTTDGSCSGSVMGTNVMTTASGESPSPSCGSFGSGEDNWYSVVVPANGELTIEMTSAGGPTDWVMSVYSGDCGALTQVECDDDDGVGAFPLISLTGQTPGDVLIVRVFEFSNNATGAFNICAHTQLCEEATATFTVRDDCADSGEFFIDIEVTGLGSATSLIASNSVDANMSTLNAGTTMVSAGPFALGTSVTVTLTPNDDVACSVVSNALTLATCPLANDDCAGAIALTDANGDPTAASGTAYDSQTGTSSGVPDPQCGGFSGDNTDDDLWFTVTAPGGPGDIITIEADDIVGLPSVDLVVALYSGDCGNLVLVDCADGGNPETITYTVPETRQDGSAISTAETYFVRVFDYGFGGGDFTVTAVVQSILPVELTSFTGESMEKVNKLFWTTAREDAADRYIVERTSTANGAWEMIGEVMAAGNSESEVSYELMDEQPTATSFYRLKMMDLDGSYEYSNIVQLENAGVLGGDLSVFPIPTANTVTVNFIAKATGTANIDLTDLNGRTISRQTVGVDTGLRTEMVDLSNVSPGVYLVRVVVDGHQLLKRVVRQ